MLSPHTTRRPITLVFIAGVLLLGGRLALATHPYEHDLGTPAPECELCQCGHVSGDAAVSGDQRLAGAPNAEHSNRGSLFPPRAARRSTHPPRAPPLLV